MRQRQPAAFHSDPFSTACWMPEETLAFCSATASVLLVKAKQPWRQDTNLVQEFEFARRQVSPAVQVSPTVQLVHRAPRPRLHSSPG